MDHCDLPFVVIIVGVLAYTLRAKHSAYLAQRQNRTGSPSAPPNGAAKQTTPGCDPRRSVRNTSAGHLRIVSSRNSAASPPVAAGRLALPAWVQIRQFKPAELDVKPWCTPLPSC